MEVADFSQRPDRGRCIELSLGPFHGVVISQVKQGILRHNVRPNILDRALSLGYVERAFRNILRLLWEEAGCTTELDYTQQTSWPLFLKYLGSLEQDMAMEAQLGGRSTLSSRIKTTAGKARPCPRIRMARWTTAKPKQAMTPRVRQPEPMIDSGIGTNINSFYQGDTFWPCHPLPSRPNNRASLINLRPFPPKPNALNSPTNESSPRWRHSRSRCCTEPSAENFSHD
jgi:hypothetical protein